MLAALLSVGAQAQARPLRIFAAASLIDALGEIGPLYANAGHAAPVFNFAASSTLARQIEQGADADVVISADEEWMDYLAARGRIDPATRARLVSNRLVLIAPRERPLTVRIAPGFDLLGALGGGRLAMADPESVPAGRYGRAALMHLGVWARISAAIAPAENVRAALRFVETGEAAAGIVYATDARAAGARVRVAGVFPETSHPPISYPMAAVLGGDGPGARAFMAFARTPAARAAFQRQGFTTR